MSDTKLPDWTDRFPFDEPYDVQEDAVEKVIENAKEGGFSAVEAACGSGKTLIALSAGIDLVRDPNTKYKRVMCLTSVKQQLRAFEDDITAINENLPNGISPVDALTIVGKADMCSYTETGHISNDEIYRTCDTLRNTVRNQINNASDEQQKVRVLNQMVGSHEVDAVGASNTLETDDWTSPYVDDHPEDDNLCAFYANYRLKKLKDEALMEDFGGMMRPEDVMQEASKKGVCPHAAMIDSLENAEVIIGNYMHAFDPLTIEAMTGDLIDEETFLVCDEAHMVVPRVRDLVSDSFSYRTLDRAIQQLDHQIINQDNGEARSAIKEELMAKGVSPEDMTDYRDFLEDVKGVYEKLVLNALDNYDENWEETVLDIRSEEDEIEYPLRPPERAEQDKLSSWLDISGNMDMAKKANLFGSAAADALEHATEEVPAINIEETYPDTIGRVMTAWVKNDNKQYFREMIAEPRDHEYEGADLEWNRHFRTSLEMKNCIPSDPIRETLNEFGGGILMSATLAPIDVYREEVGLDELESENGRPVQNLIYGLNFPEENRESMAVETTKFTSSNRGNPYGDNNDTRETYKEIVEDVVANTDGNVLVCMPSYAEAEWIEYELNPDFNPRIDKPVKADESSTNAVTQELKEWFFRGRGKVLTTSLRGTLTEGVDYDGDKLDACIVCGVPIRGLGGPYPDAIKHAYDDRFNSGFDVAFNVPAVRKARQALGRVIRGNDDKGVRVMVDERYAKDSWDSVREHLPEYEQREYDPVTEQAVERRVKAFWDYVR